MRRRIFEIIELGRHDDRASRAFELFILVMILANIAVFCAETVPEIEASYGTWFHAFELVSVVVFSIEYALRIWTAVEVPFLSRMSPLKARLKFARRPLQVLDLLAVLPFYLGTLIGLDLIVLRALRLLRLFKLSRYSPAMHTLIRVVSSEARTLTGAAILLMAALLFSSTGMYFIEGKVQPDKFGSVPLAAYWAMTTLTTVGYGDVAPITPLGKLWAMLTMLFGLCILALPVAIISSGFAQEAGRRDFVVTWSLMSRIPMLAELDTAEVAELMPMLHSRHLPPNTEVMAAGSPGDAMYFVASGEVELQSASRHSRFGTGEFFGVVAMLDNDVQAGRFVTRTRCRLLKLFREDFHRIEMRSPQIGAHIRQVAANRKAARLAAEPRSPQVRPDDKTP